MKDKEQNSSSNAVFRKICEDEFVLDAYIHYKTQPTKLPDFLLFIRKQSCRILSKYGLQFPQLNSEYQADLLKLLEANESNRRIHDKKRYDRSKKLIITSVIIDLYLTTFGIDLKTIEQQLSSSVALEIEINKEKLTANNPSEDDCNIITNN